MRDMHAHLALPGVAEAVAAVHALGITDLSILAFEACAPTKIMRRVRREGSDVKGPVRPGWQAAPVQVAFSRAGILNA